jgi:hypothetical protein
MHCDTGYSGLLRAGSTSQWEHFFGSVWQRGSALIGRQA